MEWVVLIPVFVVVYYLREAGWSWTAIMLLYDGIVYGFFCLLYRYDRKTDGKPVSRRAGIVYAVLTLLTGAGTVLLFMCVTEDILLFWTAILLPLFLGCLWFFVMIMKEDL